MKKAKLGKTVGFLALAGILILGVASCGNTAGGTGGGGTPPEKIEVAEQGNFASIDTFTGYNFGTWEASAVAAGYDANNIADARYREVCNVMDSLKEEFGKNYANDDAIKNITQETFNGAYNTIVNYSSAKIIDTNTNKNISAYSQLIAPIFKYIKTNDNANYSKTAIYFNRLTLAAYANQGGSNKKDNYNDAMDSLKGYFDNGEYGIDINDTAAMATFVNKQFDYVANNTGVDRTAIDQAVKLYITNINARSYRDKVANAAAFKEKDYPVGDTRMDPLNLENVFGQLGTNIKNAAVIPTNVISMRVNNYNRYQQSNDREMV